MAEQDIKRINYFDGQFLKEGEFFDEQYYHVHMRRRMNFILFESSGVISVSADDLKFINIDNASKTFQVKAGMAISRKNDDMECKEIILRNDSPVKDLDSEGISAGQTAYVTIHYAEKKVNVPPSEGDVDKETRVIEEPEITVHSNLPPYVPAPNGEEYILLGTLDFDTMTEDYTERQEAKIRTSLLGAAPVSLVSIEIDPVTASVQEGSTIQLTARGTFSDGNTHDLTGADGLTWESSNVAIATVSADGLVTGVSVGTTNIAARAQGKSVTASVQVVPTLTLVSIAVSPDPVTVNVGDTITFTANGTFSDGNSRPLNQADGLTWVSSDDTVATVNATGEVTGMAAGSVQITASAQGQSNSANVTVQVPTPAPVFLTGIDGTPGTQINPHGGVEGTDVFIYGRNFSVDMPTLPTVELIKAGAEVHVFNVVNVTQHTSPGGISYEVIEAKVQVVTSEDVGNIRVTTDSGGSKDTDETFALTII